MVEDIISVSQFIAISDFISILSKKQKKLATWPNESYTSEKTDILKNIFILLRLDMQILSFPVDTAN